jgi:chromate transporter
MDFVLSQGLAEVAKLFLKLGTIAFGGPAAHIAMMHDETVKKRKWLNDQQFLDLVGAANLIPGPSSTEMAIYIGYLRAGAAGLLLAGFCFILPAAILVTAIAWAYVRFGMLPEVSAIFYGIKPVVIAIVLQAIWRLGRSAVKSTFLGVVAVIATVLSFLGLNVLLVLLGSGLVVAFVRGVNRWRHTALSILFFGSTSAPAAAQGAAIASFGLWPLFLVFLKVGALLFGSGYVLLAFLHADLVQKLHWMTENQLIDAVAVGQFTPGPVFTTATFIGYVLGGLTSAIVATVAIFLPSFVYVAITGSLVPHIRKSQLAAAFLDGINVGAMALMAAVTWQLAKAAVMDITTVVLLLAAILLLLWYKLNTTWLILAGAAVGLIMHSVS